MNQTAVVLTPEHPRWDELLIPLMGRNGCNMRADVVKGWSWECEGDFAKSRAILTQMGGIDVEATLAGFEARGASCDCEVVFNVTAGN
jgi:hypothetical protein